MVNDAANSLLALAKGHGRNGSAAVVFLATCRHDFFDLFESFVENRYMG